MKDKLTALSGHLCDRHETLAVAESVTSGLLMANLSLAPNTTQFLQGGIVAYNLGQKTKHLDVDPIAADNVNCVSALIAEQMALQVSVRFCSTWGLAITGYAVPVPELKIKNCFAYYCLVYRGQPLLADKIETRLKGQRKVQNYFADQVITSLLKEMKQLE